MIRATMQPAALSQRQRVQKQRGFTLIEVLVASLLLMIVLIPLLGIFISSVSASLKAETENAASLLAQEQIEELRGLNYASLTLDSNQISATSGIDTSGYPDDPATYVWADTTYNVVAEDGGSVDPRPEIIDRRNVSFTVQRYILWVDDPTDNDTDEDYKKALVAVSWESPQPGSMTFETNIHQKGSDRQERPGVRITFPYIGDAFYSEEEIVTIDSEDETATITAEAGHRDGQRRSDRHRLPSHLHRQKRSSGANLGCRHHHLVAANLRMDRSQGLHRQQYELQHGGGIPGYQGREPKRSRTRRHDHHCLGLPLRF